MRRCQLCDPWLTERARHRSLVPCHGDHITEVPNHVKISGIRILGRDLDRCLIWAKFRLHSPGILISLGSRSSTSRMASPDVQLGRDLVWNCTSCEMPDNDTIRKSQRKPLACRHCTRAKIRCSKDIPCTRCRTKGLACSREAVIVAARNMNATRNQRRSSKQPLRSDLAQAEIPEPEETTEDRQGSLDGQRHVSDNDPGLLRVMSTVKLPQFEDVPTAIEGLAWGRHQCHQYPHAECRRPMQPAPAPEQYYVKESISCILPNLATSRMLVNFHLEQLTWYHNTIHVPTFMACCEAFWYSGVMPDPQWLPLYLSVLSASMWTLTNSCSHSGSERMSPESCRAMFDLVASQIFETNSLGRHTIYSVQAVCICAMVANVLDNSDQMTVLVNAAIRIAQCLGLHRIPDVPVGHVEWTTMVHREVGRRIWWKLVELDYHSMPYTGTTSMFLATARLQS